MPTDRGVKLLADIIVLNEITELLNSVNGSLSTSVANVKSVVDTINTNVNTVKTATAVNNTASTTGTLSQKMSSAIANTATNNTASKTGILSQKLAYVISLLENSTYGLNASKNNDINTVASVVPSSNVLLTLVNSELNHNGTTGTFNADNVNRYVYCNITGYIRVSATMKTQTSGYYAYLNIRRFRNNSWTTLSSLSSQNANYETVSLDNISVVKGDILEFGLNVSATYSAAYINSLKLCGTLGFGSNGLVPVNNFS